MENCRLYKVDQEFLDERRQAMEASTASLTTAMRRQGVQGWVLEAISDKLRQADAVKLEYLTLREQLKEREAKILHREMEMAERERATREMECLTVHHWNDLNAIKPQDH